MRDFHNAMRGGWILAGQGPATVCLADRNEAAIFSDEEIAQWARCPGREPEELPALALVIYRRPTGQARAIRLMRQWRDQRAISSAQWEAWTEDRRREREEAPSRPPEGSGPAAPSPPLPSPPPAPSRPAERPPAPPRPPATEPPRDCAWPAPADGAILSPYGMRTSRQHPGVEVMHGGIDYRGEVGSPVYAIADGTVTHATVNGAPGFGGYGITVVLKHPQWTTQLPGGTRREQMHSLYAHLSRLNVAARENVRAGDVIGYIGNTNGSESHPGTTFETTAEADGREVYSNPHLHFEMAWGSYPRPPVSQAASNPRAERVNPAEFLAGKPPCPRAPQPGAPEQQADPEPSTHTPGDPDRGRSGNALAIGVGLLLGGLILAAVFGGNE